MRKGFIAITTVLILSAVIASITATVFWLSVGESQSAFTLMKGEQALQLSEGCVEDVLSRIRTDENYAGGTIPYPEGECVVDISRDVDRRTIHAYSNANDSVRRVVVVIDRTVSGVSLVSWQEE